jgi:hypothetical protein
MVGVAMVRERSEEVLRLSVKCEYLACGCARSRSREAPSCRLPDQ